MKERFRPMPLCSPILLPTAHALAPRLILQCGVKPSWVNKWNSQLSKSASSAGDLRSYLIDIPTIGDTVVPELLLKDILVASTDTTSTMVEWVMAEILQHPGVKTKIQEELTTVIGMNNIVEESHISKLTYLDAVVKETFRLHPPLPLLIPRCPDKSCTVGGYTIPKGSTVFINVWAIHHDPENWSNPLDFKPERFLNGRWDYNGNNLKFLPFGSGRRICPGIPLGEKMLLYMLASLLHSFEWNLPTNEKFELSDEFGLVTKKRNPLVAIPSPRLSDASLAFTYDKRHFKFVH